MEKIINTQYGQLELQQDAYVSDLIGRENYYMAYATDADISIAKYIGGVWVATALVKGMRGLYYVKRKYVGCTRKEIVADFLRGVKSGEYLDRGELQ